MLRFVSKTHGLNNEFAGTGEGMARQSVHYMCGTECECECTSQYLGVIPVFKDSTDALIAKLKTY